MVIQQGDVFWANLRDPLGSEPGFRHPIVVIQNDVLNASPIETVVACIVTSCLRRAESPGNVLLGKGEANLPTRSVVNVTQIATVDKAHLLEKIGTLSRRRVLDVLAGIQLVTRPTW